MSTQSVKQGEEILFRANFYDTRGFLVNPSDLKVSIYPYSRKPNSLGIEESDAILLDAIPERTSLGHYEFNYKVDETAVSGTSYAYWTGTLPEGMLRLTQEFIIVPLFGAVHRNHVSLVQNSFYQISLNGIRAVDGDLLDPYVCSFTSSYNPMCTSYNRIITSLQSLVSGLTKDTVNFLIHRYSMDAHRITPKGIPCDADYLAFACSQYVELSIQLNVVRNLIASGGNLKSKQLGELKVAYGDSMSQLPVLVGRWKKELDGWERVLNSNGCIPFGASLPMQIAHPSLYNADRMPIGRQIREPVGSSRDANTKSILGNRTRYQHSYVRPGIRGSRTNSVHPYNRSE